MSRSFNIAIVGATGNVGREIIQILEERNFNVDNIYFLASSHSKGKKIEFNKKEFIIEDLKDFDFSKVDIGLFSAGSSVSSKYAPIAESKNCLVIDNTSYFRMDKEIPLIIPEVNGKILSDFFDNKNRRNIISNPNCSTIQMLVALKPIHDAAIINRIVVSTYQSVSGGGKNSMDELFEQTKDIYSNKNIQPKAFTKQIAFNAIPHINSFCENGDTKEEEKMINETKKILDPNIQITATCVRVPVFISHAESINIELDSPLSDIEAKKILENFDGVSVFDHRKDGGYITPIDAAGENKVFVSRLRIDNSIENGLNMWVVSDNLRKGAALNAIQIAELVIEKYADDL
tara:strand:+ start:2630 stop:3667 length:1038 start_codon:yes stop_codon:yes gene_type:complete